MKRKVFVKNRNHYASLLCKLESGKSSIKIGDMREALKIIIAFEVDLIKTKKRSALLMLRKEAKEKAAKLK